MEGVIEELEIEDVDASRRAGRGFGEDSCLVRCWDSEMRDWIRILTCWELSVSISTLHTNQ